MRISTEQEEVTIPEKYHYALMPFSVVEPMLRVPIAEDAYISNDTESRALRDLLTKGYRWVRTDNEFCVFEKIVGLVSGLPPRETEKLYSGTAKTSASAAATSLRSLRTSVGKPRCSTSPL